MLKRLRLRHSVPGFSLVRQTARKTGRTFALATVRAPIFEEKVVDFLVELAKVTDKPVTREELYKDEDEAPPAAA